jgi:hypothetical protein
MQNERQAVAGVFDTWASAQAAIDALIGAGFQPDDLSFLAPHDDAVRGGSAPREAHIDEDATRAAVARGMLGRVERWIKDVEALIVPGIGPFISAGSLKAALAGATTAGATTSGGGVIAGALRDIGVPAAQAQQCAQAACSGGILVTVRADSRYDQAADLLRRHGAYDIESRDTKTIGSLLRGIPYTAT